MGNNKKDDIKIKAKDYILYQQKHKNRIEIDVSNEDVLKAQDLKLKEFKDKLKDSINIQSPILNDNKSYNELLDKLGDHLYNNNITSNDAINLVKKELENKKFQISHIENKVDDIIYNNAISNANNQYLDDIINKTNNNTITENELKNLIDMSNNALNNQYGLKDKNNKDRFSVEDMQEDLQIWKEQRQEDLDFEKLNEDTLRIINVDEFESKITDDNLNQFFKENINENPLQSFKTAAILNQRKLVTNEDIKDQFKYEKAKDFVNENFDEIKKLKLDYEIAKPLQDISEIDFDKYLASKSTNMLNVYENYLKNKSNDKSSLINIIDNVDNDLANFEDNGLDNFNTSSLSSSVNERTATNGTIKLDTFHTDNEGVGNAGTNTLKFENLKKEYTKVFAYNPSDVSKYQLIDVKGERSEFEYKSFVKDEYKNAIQTNLSDDKIKFLIEAKDKRLISEQQFKNIVFASKGDTSVGKDVLTTMVQNYEKSPISFNQQIPDIKKIGNSLKNIKDFNDFENKIYTFKTNTNDKTINNQRVKYILNTIKSSDKNEIDRFLKANDTKLPFVSNSIKKEFLENFNKNSPDIPLIENSSDNLFKGYSTKLDEQSRQFLKDCYTNGIITNTQLRNIAQTSRKPLEVRTKVVDNIISYKGLSDLPRDLNEWDQAKKYSNGLYYAEDPDKTEIEKRVDNANDNRNYLIDRSDDLKKQLQLSENSNINYNNFKKLICNTKEKGVYAYANIKRPFENLERENQEAISDVTKNIIAKMRVSYADKEAIENTVKTLNGLKNQYRKELTFEVYKRNLDRKRIEYVLEQNKSKEEIQDRVDNYLAKQQRLYKNQSDEAKIRYVKYNNLLKDCLEKRVNPFNNDINDILKNEDLELINSIADKLKVKPYSIEDLNLNYSKTYYKTKAYKEYSKLYSKAKDERFKNKMISRYNDYAIIGVEKMRPLINDAVKKSKLMLEEGHEDIINISKAISKHSAMLAKEHHKYQMLDNKVQSLTKSVINKTFKEDSKESYYKIYNTIAAQPDALRNIKNKVIVDLSARYHNSYVMTTLLMAKKLGIYTKVKTKEVKSFVDLQKKIYKNDPKLNERIEFKGIRKTLIDNISDTSRARTNRLFKKYGINITLLSTKEKQIQYLKDIAEGNKKINVFSKRKLKKTEKKLDKNRALSEKYKKQASRRMARQYTYMVVSKYIQAGLKDNQYASDFYRTARIYSLNYDIARYLIATPFRATIFSINFYRLFKKYYESSHRIFKGLHLKKSQKALFAALNAKRRKGELIKPRKKKLSVLALRALNNIRYVNDYGQDLSNAVLKAHTTAIATKKAIKTTKKATKKVGKEIAKIPQRIKKLTVFIAKVKAAITKVVLAVGKFIAATVGFIAANSVPIVAVASTLIIVLAFMGSFTIITDMFMVREEYDPATRFYDRITKLDYEKNKEANKQYKEMLSKARTKYNQTQQGVLTSPIHVPMVERELIQEPFRKKEDDNNIFIRTDALRLLYYLETLYSDDNLEKFTTYDKDMSSKIERPAQAFSSTKAKFENISKDSLKEMDLGDVASNIRNKANTVTGNYEINYPKELGGVQKLKNRTAIEYRDPVTMLMKIHGELHNKAYSKNITLRRVDVFGYKKDSSGNMIRYKKGTVPIQGTKFGSVPFDNWYNPFAIKKFSQIKDNSPDKMIYKSNLGIDRLALIEGGGERVSSLDDMMNNIVYEYENPLGYEKKTGEGINWIRRNPKTYYSEVDAKVIKNPNNPHEFPTTYIRRRYGHEGDQDKIGFLKSIGMIFDKDKSVDDDKDVNTVIDVVVSNTGNGTDKQIDENASTIYSPMDGKVMVASNSFKDSDTKLKQANRMGGEYVIIKDVLKKHKFEGDMTDEDGDKIDLDEENKEADKKEDKKEDKSDKSDESNDEMMMMMLGGLDKSSMDKIKDKIVKSNNNYIVSAGDPLGTVKLTQKAQPKPRWNDVSALGTTAVNPLTTNPNDPGSPLYKYNLTAEEWTRIFKKYFPRSSMLVENHPHAAGFFDEVVASEKRTGISPAFMLAIIQTENGGAFGKFGYGARVAAQKNNILSWNATDINTYTNANGFRNFAECYGFVCNKLNQLYLTPGGRYYNGQSVAGVSKLYCSDSNGWQTSVSLFMARIYEAVQKESLGSKHNQTQSPSTPVTNPTENNSISPDLVTKVKVTATGIYPTKETPNTPNGTPIKKGIILADGSIIAKGAKVEIPGYGNATVDGSTNETRGYNIKVAFNTKEEAIAFGKKSLEISVHTKTKLNTNPNEVDPTKEIKRTKETANDTEKYESVLYMNMFYQYKPGENESFINKFLKGEIRRAYLNPAMRMSSGIIDQKNAKSYMLETGWASMQNDFEEFQDSLGKVDAAPQFTGGYDGSYGFSGSREKSQMGTIPDNLRVFKPHSTGANWTNKSPWGECVWYVYNRSRELGGYHLYSMGDGGNWRYSAARGHCGTKIISKPVAGCALSTVGGAYGHIMFVEAVNPDGSVWVSEYNYIRKKYSERLLSPGYIRARNGVFIDIGVSQNANNMMKH
ncbi:CHAP domain-containing protein (plasmid) [Finegoldia magna]|uniref:CHAP domain-containing protein n=1 Tax=Finegoldia magna TaxID=1260 RepID=UPI00370D90FD